MSIIFDNRNRISHADQAGQDRQALRAGAAARTCAGSSATSSCSAAARTRKAALDLEVGANFLALESRPRGTHLWGGRTTYRLRRTDEGVRLAYKKVVLVDNEQAVPTLGFLI